MTDKKKMPDNMPETIADLEARRLIAQFSSLLPNGLASDERDARRNKIAERMERGDQFEKDHTLLQLRGVLGSISQRIFIYDNGGRRLLATPKHVLAYIEHTADYAMEDFRFDSEWDNITMALWDSIDNIHTAARAWRTGEYAGDGTAVLESIMRTSIGAITGKPELLADDEGDDDA